MNETRYIDLFGGIGGFRLGIEKATKGKWKCVWYCDSDKYAVQAYNRNFNENHAPTDIREASVESIPNFDILCAGFPCQSFSIAGKRKGFEDTRGTLFFEICRIAEFHRPKLLFLENVKGLLNHDNGKTFRTILRAIDQLGYDAQWEVLNSKNFGVPQNRERVFIVANLRGTPRPEVFPLGKNGEKAPVLQRLKVGAITTRTGNAQSNGDYIVESDRKAQIVRVDKQEGRDREIYRVYNPEGIAPALHGKTGGWQEPKIIQPHRDNELREYEDTIPTIQTSGRNSPQNIFMINAHQFGTGERGNGIKENMSFTLDSGSGRDFLIPSGTKIRRLTPVECARLQGFPDNWHVGLSDTQAYKCYGNAVTVNVVQAIVEKMIER